MCRPRMTEMQAQFWLSSRSCSGFTGAAPHAAHLSLAQVEKLSGIPANIIDLLEVGIKPVDLGHLHQLAKAYGKAVKITLI